MDPGNWATDLAGGAQFGYTLLVVVMISNFMAILLQHLCIKLGVATGRDLAQACRDHYSTPTVWCLWILCETAIAACDLAEVVGSAIALQLLADERLPLHRGVGDHLDCDHRQLLCSRADFLEAESRRRHARVRAGDAHPHESGDALHQHRHHRRDRNAAQSLPALVDCADTQV